MSPPRTNSVLLRGLNAGHSPSELWRQFYETYRSIVLHWCRRAGLQEDRAEDVLQVAMTKIFCQLHTYDRAKGRFTPWIKTIVMNEIRDRYRRDANDVSPAAPGGSVNQRLVDAISAPNEHELEQESRVADVFRTVRNRVTEANWNMFIRCKFLGEEAASVATEFGIKRASVYQNLSRITKLLRTECQSALWSETNESARSRDWNK